MSKQVRQYLIVSYVISFMCFGAMALSQQSFSQYMQQPLWLLVFVLGCLGPAAGAVFVFLRNKSLGGINGLVGRIKAAAPPKAWLMVAVFLILHHGLSVMLRATDKGGSVLRFVQYLPLMLLLFGSQEIGWRMIVQPGLEENRGFWKASICTGLFWAIWFLPLLFVPGFVIRPDFFMQFAAYLVGLSALLAVLYRRTGTVLCCIVFTSIVFAMTALMPLRQSNIIALLALIDIVIAAAHKANLLTLQEQ